MTMTTHPQETTRDARWAEDLSGNRGFTLVELITVVAVIGILVNIAVPASVSLIRKARAVKVITDFEVVQSAVYVAYAADESYPKTGKWGQAPQELAPHLPKDFDFSYGKLKYRWKLWSFPNGTPRNRRQTVLMGLQVRGNDKKLIQAIQSQWNGRVFKAGKKTLTIVVL